MSALFSKKVYIVEGINDELFLKKLLIKTGKQYEQYNIFQCYGKPHFFPFITIFKSLGIEVVILFDEDKITNEINVKINTALEQNKHYKFTSCLEDEIGYEDKYNTPEFLEFLDNFNSYEQYFDIVD